MNKELAFGIIGGLTGVIIGIFLASTAVNRQNYPVMQRMGMRNMMTESIGCKMGDLTENSEVSVGHMNESMTQMSQGLEDLKDEDFDKVFIETMIDHHRGAIEMADLVKTNTKRRELLDLADDIVEAQSREIEMMTGWANEWFGE